MPNLGAHVSTSGGLHTIFERAATAGCNTIQLFSKSQRQWNCKDLTAQELDRFHSEHRAAGSCPLIVHDSYLINLGSPDDALWEKSIAAFAVELERCRQLGVPALVTHPGAHVGSGDDAALERVGAALRRLLEQGVGGETQILLENTAGQGTTLAYRFEHLGRLLELTDGHQRLGVCIDTCHLLASGYEFRSQASYDETFGAFDRLVGLERIKAFHLNDSKNDLGSKVDRHTHIGEGFVGLEAFGLLVNDARFRSLPMVLETPKEPDETADITNLTTLRGLRRAAVAE
ncbi:MAG TPA: deoxyribonuclease IV [Herpetosiphonaceae bacterium]